jgi:hypothetical protein
MEDLRMSNNDEVTTGLEKVPMATIQIECLQRAITKVNERSLEAKRALSNLENRHYRQVAELGRLLRSCKDGKDTRAAKDEREGSNA